MDDNDLQHDPHDLRRYVEAFADGELDVETNLRVLERMAMSPQATQRVMHQQELRKLVDRAMRQQAPAVPEKLRQQIMAIAAAAVREEATRQTERTSRGPVLAQLRRWAPAMAAVLLLALGVAWALKQASSGDAPSNSNRVVLIPPETDGGAPAQLVGLDHPQYRDDLLESRRVTAMGTRHESCSSETENLYRAEEFSTSLSEVPAKITQYLGPQIHVPRPDLSALGYEYQGTGACSLPGGKAVHLVYRPIGSAGRADSLSLWIRSDETGQLKVEEGRLYTVTPEGSKHPVLVWRRGTAVYYLVGERSSLMKAAAVTLYASR